MSTPVIDLEELAGQMAEDYQCHVDANVDLAGIGLGIGDELGNGFNWNAMDSPP